MTKKYVYICGIRFFISNYKNIVETIKVSTKRKVIFAPLATHPVMEAYFNDKLKNIYGEIQYLLPDGYIVWAIHFLFGIHFQKRIYGPDLLLNVSKMCEETKKPIFLCGNNCELVKFKLKKIFPDLKVGGTFEMGGIEYSSSIAKKISGLIKETHSACVFVGIGSPNQHIYLSCLA
ncbi:MAG: WecB/TagA/CpsF family glycosyltransferase [Candidatus Roizmanbacteria bacterium]|nr:WecB/TagA/CpsF family glycosyltransferase [Candidatus Roizmanbacteria bacterium]